MSKELVIELGKKLEEMEAKGLTDTPEYEKLSDDWQTLALAEVEEDIFGSLEDILNEPDKS